MISSWQALGETAVPQAGPAWWLWPGQSHGPREEKSSVSFILFLFTVWVTGVAALLPPRRLLESSTGYQIGRQSSFPQGTILPAQGLWLLSLVFAASGVLTLSLHLRFVNRA